MKHIYTMPMRYMVLLAGLSIVQMLGAQSVYFQQEVNYRIRASLNDTLHTLQAYAQIEYVNRSPHALTEIWMHLWPNGYKNRRTAFCRQQLRLGNSDFYFAPDSSLGYIDQLAFRADGQPIEWRHHPQHPDIALLTLPQPLPPGGRVVLETPFFVKIPASFSRLGHVGQSYQISQWYPKPAVYDARGWHAMPYLEMGEFYSEFGSFEVELTLPENYVVMATGVLESPEEEAFLARKVEEAKAFLESGAWPVAEGRREGAFPPSSPRLKTVRFRAERVHDFAWFADKRFRILHERAVLPSGRAIDCWAAFTDEQAPWWKEAARYVRRAILFYSERVGEYPWPQATAVQASLKAGGGMEYPMITVIDAVSDAKTLDQVIAHEVGHNWFYGILASNERDYPWMDEGLNTFYEQLYMQQYYGDKFLHTEGPKWLKPEGSLTEVLLSTLSRVGSPATPSSAVERFSSLGYYANAYVKPALCLRWLERSAGPLLLERAMQQYYLRWQFRHPYPEDLRETWKSAGLEADWFFELMRSPRTFDLALRGVQRLPNGDFALWVRRRGALRAPYSVSALRQGRVVQTQWYPAIEGSETTVNFPAVEADAFQLDAERLTLDLYRSNNTRRVGRLSTGCLRPKISPLALLERSDRMLIGVLPWVAWNQYDKTTVGVAFYSPLLPPQRLRYYLLPGFSLGSERVTGLADVQYRLLVGGVVPQATVRLHFRTAIYAARSGETNYRLPYFRWVPSLRLQLRSPSPVILHELGMRAVFIEKDEPIFSAQGAFRGVSRPSAHVYELRYERRNWAQPNPYFAAIVLEGQRYSVRQAPAGYVRASAEWIQEFYYRPKKRLYARFFAGYFLYNTQRFRGSVATNNLTGDVARASFVLNPQGFNDYRFDQVFLARSDSRGFLSRQVSQTEGGFKNALGQPYAQVFGNSNDFILALNLRADVPSVPLLKPYFDVGYFNDATPIGASRPFSEQFVWSGGLMVEVLRGRLELYFPLVHSNYLSQLYRSATQNYWQRISWSIRIEPVRASHLERLLNSLNNP